MSQTLIDTPETDNANPGDRHWNDEFNNIVAGEHNTDNSYGNNDTKQAGDLADNNTASAAVGAGESNTPGTWSSRVTGQNKDGASFAQRAKKLVSKRNGPIAIISTILVGAGISLSMLFSPTMLLVHMKEVLVNKFNIQSTALDARADKLLQKKLASVGTSGCGSVVKITCKFSKMSDNMLKSLDESGFTAVDKAGNPLKLEDGSWSSNRPAGFIPPDSITAADGTVKDIKLPEGKSAIAAGDFSKFLKDNPAAAGVYKKAFNIDWATFWDSTYNKFLGRIGWSKSEKITGDDEKSIEESIKENEDGDVPKEPINAEAQPNTGNDKAAQDANTASTQEATQANELIGEAGKETGSSLTSSIKKLLTPEFLLNLGCMASSSGQIAKGLRAIQMAELVVFGLTFLQVADEIKTGTASPEKVSAVAMLFTQSLVDSKGSVVKKSAMESDTLMYGLVGNTVMNSTTSDYSEYIPGGGIVKFLNKVEQIIHQAVGTTGANGISSVCSVVNSTAGQITQTGFNLIMDFTPIGAITGALGIFLQSTGLLDKIIVPIMKQLAGKIIDSSSVDEDFGNAFGTSAILGIGEGGNAGAMMPMSVDQAVVYSQQTTQDQLANAKIDRTMYSAFDASNPNTFMGSIYTQLIPYYGMMSTGPFGALGAITKVVGSTFGALFSPQAFADSGLTAAELRSCPDTSITDAGIAAGPVCDVQYGIPVKYLNSIDPTDNLNQLINNGQVDETTGDPISDAPTTISGSDGQQWNLSDYITNCAKGDGTASIAECMITGSDEATKASWAVYSVDHRIQKNMDGEETYGGNSGLVSTTTSSAQGAGTTGKDDVPTEWRARIGGVWLGMIPGQCAAFAAWRFAQQWYGALLKADGSNLADLIQTHPIPHFGNLALGNGDQVAGNLISAGLADRVDTLADTQPGDIVSVRTGKAAGHVFIILSNVNGVITTEDYDYTAPNTYGTHTIGKNGYYTQSSVIAIARVHAGGGD